jgi:hypothetical protein
MDKYERRQVRIQYFLLVVGWWVANIEAIYNLLLILKFML